MKFKDQIKDPRWQKRRLEIFQKDDFTCQICGDKESTLNVHHFHYDKNKKYWEYGDWELITLCELCHENEHILKDNITDYINEINKVGVTYHEISAFLGEIHSMLIGSPRINPMSIIEIFGDKIHKNTIKDIESLSERRNKLLKIWPEDQQSKE